MCSDISDIPQQVVLEEETETLDEVVVVARAIQTKPIIGGIECKIRNKTITGNRSIADLLSYIPLVATSGLESLRVADKKMLFSISMGVVLVSLLLLYLAI